MGAWGTDTYIQHPCFDWFHGLVDSDEFLRVWGSGFHDVFHRTSRFQIDSIDVD